MQIIEKLKKKFKDSGGHCGLYITHFSGDLKEIRKELNLLYKEGKITVHDGIHGQLIKFKPQAN